MKRWIGKLLLALLVPVVLLGMTEGMLRLFDVGYPTSFLVPAEVDGEAVWVENPFFTYQIFSPPLARTPSPIVVKKDKPADAFRVVVLGESAAQGDPVPAFGPPRMLEYTLRHSNPEANVEVINASVTAINSHIIREIARDLKKLQPDVVILYIGNNEIIGPYGPGTVFAGFVDRDAVIRVMTWLGRMRLVQLFRFGATLVAEGRQQERFQGVAMFMNHPVAYDDPRLDAVRRRFRSNLEAIINEAHDAGAHILLSTVAVNLTDCPPSISVSRPTLSAAERTAWQAAYDQGVTAARSGNWNQARTSFEQAANLDDGHAELNYWLGITLANLDQREASMTAYIRAMDRDAFRYRTDSRINDIIREVATTSPVPVTLADAATYFAEIPGETARELFVDHVHFSFDGNVQLTRLWADQLIAQTMFSPPQPHQPLPHADELRQQMMFTQVSETDILQRMLARYRQPPFNRQLDIKERIQGYASRIAALTAALRAMEDDEIPERFRARMKDVPDDLYFPLHYAQYLVSFNRYREAKTVLESAIHRHPHRRGPRAILAHVLAMEGQVEKAADILLGAKRKQGYFAHGETAHVMNALLPGGYFSEAAGIVRAVEHQVRPLDYRWRIRNELKALEMVQALYQQAMDAVDQGQLALAEQLLTTLNARRGDLGDVLFWLGVIQGKKGEPAKGYPFIQQAIGKMNFARAYYHGGLWQARLGVFGEALELLAMAERHAHDDLILVNSLAWIYAADVRGQMRNPAKARALMERVLAHMEVPPAFMLDTYSAVLAATGDMTAAQENAQRAHAQALQEDNPMLADEIQKSMTFYQEGKPAPWRKHNRPLNYF